MMYLVQKPYRTGYEFADKPLSAAQRNWLLNHPALTKASRAARAHKHWQSILMWTTLVKPYMREWKSARAPLPEPHMDNVTTLKTRLMSMPPQNSNSPHCKTMLAWVPFLAKESPTVLRSVLRIMPIQKKSRGQWCADLVEAVASTGRVALLHDRLQAFNRQADPQTRKEKVWQWANTAAFAVPRIARALIRIALVVLSSPLREKGLSRKLLQSTAIVSTIDSIVVWLVAKLEDRTLMNLASKKSFPEVAAALRATPRYKSLRRLATLRASVCLTSFFRNRVTLEKARAAHRGDCPICWAPKILMPLHGDMRHGMCHTCKRNMERNNMLDRCPMCRIAL
jgi:hypothetical protein